MRRTILCLREKINRESDIGLGKLRGFLGAHLQAAELRLNLGGKIFIPARAIQIESRARGRSHQLLLQTERALTAKAPKCADAAAAAVDGGIEPREIAVQSVFRFHLAQLGVGAGAAQFLQVNLGWMKDSPRIAKSGSIGRK